jgi:membrane associated rhomboid family serine protease
LHFDAKLGIRFFAPVPRVSLIDQLGKKLGRYAISGLPRIIVAFNALVYLLRLINPDYISLIELDPARVLKGEVWRLVTYIFIPPEVGLIWIFFALWFLLFVGEGLEQAWGAFKLNLYYLCGMIGCTIAAFMFGGVTTNAFLNTSMLLAFATVYPDEIIYLFLILPVKMKWLGWITAAVLVATFVTSAFAIQMAMIASISNYIIFFAGDWIRSLRERAQIAERRRKFESSSASADSLHHCVICNRTEVTAPDMDFRVARDGNEYCVEHLPRNSTAGRSAGEAHG